MEQRHFMEMLRRKWGEQKFVCVGLDSSAKMVVKIAGVHGSGDADSVYNFNLKIVAATYDIVCAFKVNSAFYEELGWPGWETLRGTIDLIRSRFPDVPVIYDAKRADIGNTNDAYAYAAFEELGADAITVNPYLSGEALAPFLKWANKGVIVLCRTSNKGAGEFQDLPVNGKPLYQQVAKNVSEKWNANGNCGLVVGATYPGELRLVREIIGDDMPILIPGVGTQGGDVQAAVEAGLNKSGNGIIVNASRSIIFASSEANFAEKAREEAEKLHRLISKAIEQVKEKK